MVKFCKLVKEALKDEGEGVKFYAKMKKVAPKEARRLIEHIKNDEKNHKQVMKRLKKEYCNG